MLDDLGRLDPNSSLPPYRQIALRLHTAIRSAPPGTKLPSGAVLAAHFGVARMTVQSAIAELAGDGLVVGRQGQGVFVTGRTGAGSFDLADVLRRARATGAVPDADELAARTGVPTDTARRALDVLHAERLASPRLTSEVAESVLDSALSAVRAAGHVLSLLPRTQRETGRCTVQLDALQRGVQDIATAMSAPLIDSPFPSSPYAWAHDLAREYLADALPQRWEHTKAVAVHAVELAHSFDDQDFHALVNAAWLHDIGYSPELATTGFHPLDGARFLRDRGFDDRVAALVAHHSAARSEADQIGLADELAEFDDEPGPVRDLLWLCDMTVGPQGQAMTFDERMTEVAARYGPDHYVTGAMTAGMPERAAAVERATAWIAEQTDPT
ncbi:GntR family transcriptional regulator [Pseudonocardia xishanensis]|uniref:HTH gntR-type domain-containing protein n=1 Tax=Pseudonocardia xishanensis TaxID=630995 RepID=A0ABP8RDH2_9PSEU